MKLFKTKNQKKLEVCKDIKVILNGSIHTIDDMQNNIKEYQRLCAENLNIFDEIIDYIDKLEGDKE